MLKALSMSVVSQTCQIVANIYASQKFGLLGGFVRYAKNLVENLINKTPKNSFNIYQLLMFFLFFQFKKKKNKKFIFKAGLVCF
jgi:hypothetical protein